MTEVALSRGTRWEPTAEYLAELYDRSDVADAAGYAASEWLRKEGRADEIRSREFPDAARELLRKMRYLSRLIGTARGEDRRGQAAMLDQTTEDMEEAREELPEARRAVKKARERCEDLEDEYSQIRQFQAANYYPAAVRRVSLPKLDDRQEVMRRFGTPPSPSELDARARQMGTAKPAE